MGEVGVPAEPAGAGVRERDTVTVEPPAATAVELSQVVKRFDDVTAVLADPAIYPPDDVLDDLTFLEDTGETEILYNDLFTQAKS